MSPTRPLPPNPAAAHPDLQDVDPELRKELAGLFLEDAPKLLEEIRTAITGHDGPGLKQAAHTLKGSVGVFKDSVAHEAALRMEHLGRDADWDHAGAAWVDLSREVARLSAELATLIGS